MADRIRFGTSGIPPNFWDSSYSKGKEPRLNYPLWISEIGLSAYEVLFTYGVRMSEERALILKKNAKEKDVWLTIHAPYYVVLTSDKKDVQKRSIQRLVKSIKLAKILNAHNVVFHCGYYGDDSKAAFNQFIKNLKQAVNEAKPLGKIKISPEIGGKKSQMGALEDIIRICEEVDHTSPCIDFAHLHAREVGSLEHKNRFREVLNLIEKRLGKEQLENLHCHFYPVEYTDKGEKVHKAFFEKEYYPHFKPFGDLIKEYKMKPTLISESKDSQDLGALEMKQYFKKK